LEEAVELPAAPGRSAEKEWANEHRGSISDSGMCDFSFAFSRMKIMRTNVLGKVSAVLAMVVLSGCYSDGHWRMPWQSTPFSTPAGATPGTVGAPRKPSEIASRNTSLASNRYADTAPAWSSPAPPASSNAANTNYNYPTTPYPTTTGAAQAGYAQNAGVPNTGASAYTAGNTGAPGAGTYGVPPSSAADTRNPYDNGGATAPGGSASDQGNPGSAPPTNGYAPAAAPANGYAPANAFPPSTVRAASGVDPSRYGTPSPDAGGGANGYSPPNAGAAGTGGYSPAPVGPTNTTPDATPYAPPSNTINNGPANGTVQPPVYRPGSVSEYRRANTIATPTDSGVMPASYTPTNAPATENNSSMPPTGSSYYTPPAGSNYPTTPAVGTRY
jgi:hypothetical protein